MHVQYGLLQSMQPGNCAMHLHAVNEGECQGGSHFSLPPSCLALVLEVHGPFPA